MRVLRDNCSCLVLVYRASDKDVRDKQSLADARATIERRMERFKECEKDMKVKDFSKVGLEKGNKLDPKQVAIEERREWIKACVEQISNTVRSMALCGLCFSGNNSFMTMKACLNRSCRSR